MLSDPRLRAKASERISDSPCPANAGHDIRRKDALAERLLLSAILLTAACRTPPPLSLAHLAERAASWSASAQFALQLRRDARVPDSYVRNVMSAGAAEVSTLRGQILSVKDAAGSDARTRAAALCAQLAAALQQGRQNGAADDDALRDVEMQLRELAQRERAAAVAGGGA